MDVASPEDVEALQRQFNGYVTEWKKRKRAAKDMVAQVGEGAAKSWKEKKFCEEQGLETDEEHKVKLEDFVALQRDVRPLPKAAPKGKAKK